MPRPSTYKSDYLDLCVRLCQDEGFEDKQLANAIGVAISTFYNWKRENEDFAKAIREAKRQYDSNTVEKALLQRALGFVAQKQVAHVVDEKIVKTWLKVPVAPDIRSITFWLINRSKEWTIDGKNEGFEDSPTIKIDI